MLGKIEFYYFSYQRLIGFLVDVLFLVSLFYIAFVVYPEQMQGKVTSEVVKAFEVFLDMPGAQYIIGFFGLIGIVAGVTICFALRLIDHIDAKPSMVNCDSMFQNEPAAKWLL